MLPTPVRLVLAIKHAKDCACSREMHASRVLSHAAQLWQVDPATLAALLVEAAVAAQRAREALQVQAHDSAIDHDRGRLGPRNPQWLARRELREAGDAD